VNELLQGKYYNPDNLGEKREQKIDKEMAKRDKA
jgi:hypothetical protein